MSYALWLAWLNRDWRRRACHMSIPPRQNPWGKNSGLSVYLRAQPLYMHHRLSDRLRLAYCETSALTQSGLKSCFDTCIRAALNPSSSTKKGVVCISFGLRNINVVTNVLWFSQSQRARSLANLARVLVPTILLLTTSLPCFLVRNLRHTSILRRAPLLMTWRASSVTPLLMTSNLFPKVLSLSRLCS